MNAAAYQDNRGYDELESERTKYEEQRMLLNVMYAKMKLFI